MADFCLECIGDVVPELVGTGLNDLASLCEPGEMVWEPFGKADKILLVFLAAMSWFGVALFIGVTFAFMAWFRMYAVGRRIENWLERITADL